MSHDTAPDHAVHKSPEIRTHAIRMASDATVEITPADAHEWITVYAGDPEYHPCVSLNHDEAVVLAQFILLHAEADQ